MPALHVWMNGERVGEWTTTRGSPRFRYDADWAASPRARALSLSLPITADRELRGDVVDAYFDNLLPDNPDIRRRIRDRHGLRSTGAFEMLEAIGRDCVGAVQLLPGGHEPVGWNRVDAEPLAPDAVARHLRRLVGTGPLGDRDALDDFRISIAGAQEKTALLRIGGAWYRPLNATPTTHILKLPLGIIGNFRGDFSNSVENEWLCARFLRELGLKAADTEIATFDDQRVLVVERFDRRWVGVDASVVRRTGGAPPAGAWIARLPQEDFCQATGRPPSRRYESEGGPSADEILDVLARSRAPARDRGDFVIAQVAFWLLAATDGHAKNFSIAHGPANAFELTPLYDVLSAWPIIGHGTNRLSKQDVKLAMAVRGKSRHYRLLEIQSRHWHALAVRIGGRELRDAVVERVRGANVAMQRVLDALPTGFPESVSGPIASGVREQVERFEAGLAAG